jgi:hypothetical protein
MWAQIGFIVPLKKPEAASIRIGVAVSYINCAHATGDALMDAICIGSRIDSRAPKSAPENPAAALNTPETPSLTELETPFTSVPAVDSSLLRRGESKSASMRVRVTMRVASPTTAPPFKMFSSVGSAFNIAMSHTADSHSLLLAAYTESKNASSDSSCMPQLPWALCISSLGGHTPDARACIRSQTANGLAMKLTGTLAKCTTAAREWPTAPPRSATRRAG